MKQIIANDREEARKFCKGGRKQSQRIAYWKEGSRAFRFERIPGENNPTWQADVGGQWWSAKLTVAQKLGINPISAAAAALGRKGGSARSDRKTAAARQNAKLGGRPHKKD